MAPLPVDASGRDGRGCARLGAGGTPALPGSRHPMTSSHQWHKIAEAFGRRLSLKQVHLSSGLFVFIRVHSWFVFINDRSFFLERSARQGGGLARGQTGVSQRGQAGLQRSRPPDTPHLTIGTPHPGARASRPHAVPSVAAQFPCDVAADHPVGGNRIGQAEGVPWRRCRLMQVGEMAEAVPGLVRAGRPRSREAVIP